MALVVFGEKIDFTSIPYPDQGGYVVGYNVVDGLLSQMDYLGVVTPIAGSAGAGTLFSTLGLGNFTGTHSIVLDSSIIKGTNKISLDSGIVSITTDNALYQESYLFLNTTEANLGNGLSSFKIDSTGITTRWSATDKQTLNTNSYELLLNNLSTLQFGKTTSGSGSKLSGLISTENSTIGSGVTNTVVIGGQNINGVQSNSVYVPFLLIQDGKVIKGTKGTGEIQFTETGDVISSNNNSVIGIISSTSSLAFTTKNGIFIKDSVTASSSPNVDTGITYISTKESSATASIKNSVIIGGESLVATEDNTVYLGNNVNINNAYKLPSTDGTIDQVLKTDGVGNVTWGQLSATLNLVTIDRLSFAALGGSFSVDTTYVITDADTALYGGTEIYLTTNSNGVLNEDGIGKFYNPKYDQNVLGFGIFSTSSTYAVASKTIWGGYVWQNTTGTHSSPTNLFQINGIVENWVEIPFDEVNYNISYDRIKYDWQNDMIVYRSEKNSNIVSTSRANIDTIKNINILFNPIKSFQWGNVYSFSTLKGIGGQNIVNSYNENINFRGNAQVNISMNNLSAQYNLNIGTIYTQSNLTFDNYLYNRQSLLLSVDENGLVFQGNLPQQNPTTLVGKINNQQVEINLAATSLVTPTIRGRWDIFNSDGTTPFGPTSIGGTIVGTFSNIITSSTNTLIVPTGCRVSFTGTSSIPAATTGTSIPTTRTGSFAFSGTTYPVVSATLSTTGLSASTTYTTTLTKPRTGLIVSGSQVIVATGSDVTSVNAQVTFNNLFYFGYLTVGLVGITITSSAPYVDGITASQIEGLGNYRFGGRAQTFVSSDGGAGSRLVFAYPSSLGNLTSLLKQGDAIDSLGAFTRRTNPLVITTLSGMTMSYHVYVANADDAWGNSGASVTLITT